jgi:hypothetical protein
MPIGKPQYDTRPGVLASATARLWIVATICAVQYWLLTGAMEAMHEGNSQVALRVFLASIFCFVLAAGLVLTGEFGHQRIRQQTRKDSE